MDAPARARPEGALRRFLRARLSREGVLGLQLTLGALVLLAAAWAFGGIAEDVVHSDPIVALDANLATWLHAHGTPTMTRTMRVVSWLHGIAAIGVLGVLFALFLAWRRQRDWLLVLVLCLPAGMLLNSLLKLAFARVRPHFDDPLVVLSTWSFPSGHVAGATLFYGVLACYLVARSRGRGERIAIVAAAGLMVALVAASRMYLGAHWFSDVLAAFLEGIAWLALCVTGVGVHVRRRSAREGSGA
jgi:membrane-associated phospholipid phosphatase